MFSYAVPQYKAECESITIWIFDRICRVYRNDNILNSKSRLGTSMSNKLTNSFIYLVTNKNHEIDDNYLAYMKSKLIKLKRSPRIWKTEKPHKLISIQEVHKWIYIQSSWGYLIKGSLELLL